MRRSGLILARSLVVIAVLPAPTFAADEKGGNLWPWSSQNAKEPPKVQPYEVPTFGAKRNFKDAPAQWQKAPKVDGDAVFRTIIACYPNKPIFLCYPDPVSSKPATGIEGGDGFFGLAAMIFSMM